MFCNNDEIAFSRNWHAVEDSLEWSLEASTWENPVVELTMREIQVYKWEKLDLKLLQHLWTTVKHWPQTDWISDSSDKVASPLQIRRHRAWHTSPKMLLEIYTSTPNRRWTEGAQWIQIIFPCKNKQVAEIWWYKEMKWERVARESVLLSQNSCRVIEFFIWVTLS